MDEYSFCYVECDIPEGMTLDEWRRRPRPGSHHRARFHLPRLRRRRHR